MIFAFITLLISETTENANKTKHTLFRIRIFGYARKFIFHLFLQSAIRLLFMLLDDVTKFPYET